LVTSFLFDGTDELALQHHADPIGQVEHVVDVVTDEEDADALGLQLSDELANLSRLGRPESGGGSSMIRILALKCTARAMATDWR
jgi:hypothetical protein